MRAGKLRHQIRLEKPEDARRASGESRTAWKSAGVVYADLRPLTGKERQAAMQVTAEATWKATLRAVPGVSIDRTFRVVELATGRVLDVVDVRDVMNRGRDLVLTLKEHADA
ncbi:MAG: phage head closure protein [Planctomycetota bacterium]